MSDSSEQKEYEKARIAAEAYGNRTDDYSTLEFVKLHRKAEVQALYAGIYGKDIWHWQTVAREHRDTWVNAVQVAIDSDELVDRHELGEDL
jgi:hypothetical protein